jgi:small ligand-binding sensory domain FIST
MKWASALSGKDYLGGQSYGSVRELIHECAEKISFQLEGQIPDLVIVFVSSDFQNEFDQIPLHLKNELAAKNIIGCSGGGLIGGGVEVEHEKAVAITACILPDVEIKPFHFNDKALPDLDASPQQWENLVSVKAADSPSFILLPDPFAFNIDNLVQGLDYAFPQSVKLGGLASGASHAGANALFYQDKAFHEGVVGVSLSGNLLVDSLVAQGCRPIGRTFRITSCSENYLVELDGVRAVHALKGVLDGLSERDQALARNSLFLGVVMNEFQEEFKAGDFLIRNIMGIEQQTGALVIGDVLNKERTVQFHIRDAQTSADDLRELLSSYTQREDSPDNKNVQDCGALLFSCLGRGKRLYGEPNHDSNLFREFLGEIPLGGFFCNGEIGPVGGTTFLHGYTSSFGIFREKVTAKND